MYGGAKTLSCIPVPFQKDFAIMGHFAAASFLIFARINLTKSVQMANLK